MKNENSVGELAMELTKLDLFDELFPFIEDLSDKGYTNVMIREVCQEILSELQMIEEQ